MILLEQATVAEIVRDEDDPIEVVVSYRDGTINHALAYKNFVSSLTIGDLVLSNRTAVSLGLGTGGSDFIVANLSQPDVSRPAGGHIMKLRYTPLQMAVKSLEEESSEFHQLFNQQSSLANFPVIIGSLHSMLAPSVLGVHAAASNVKVVYIMSDGGCLPLAYSRTVKLLKKLHLLSGTITYGHAFGGDYEAVNIFTALLAAKYCLQADLAIVAMGPGIVGTGTVWGHTGIEQGIIANAVAALEGTPIMVPRLNFGDARLRHWGLSHHTLTVLEKVCTSPATVVLPVLPAEHYRLVMEKIVAKGLWNRYNFLTIDGKAPLQMAEKLAIPLQTMGRGIQSEAAYFEAAAAAGIYAAQLLFP